MSKKGQKISKYLPRLAVVLLCTIALLSSQPARAASNVGDLALRLAQQLNIPADSPEAALAALKAQGIIPANMNANTPVTAAIAQSVSTGLITAGRSPAAAAQVIAASAAAAGVPVNVVVQGAMQAASAAGANVAAVAQAATRGAVQGAQVAGVNVAAIVQAASSGAVQGALATGASVTAVVQAASSGAVQGARAVGISVAAVAQAAAKGTAVGAAASGISAGIAAAYVQAAARGAVAGGASVDVAAITAAAQAVAPVAPTGTPPPAGAAATPEVDSLATDPTLNQLAQQGSSRTNIQQQIETGSTTTATTAPTPTASSLVGCSGTCFSIFNSLSSSEQAKIGSTSTISTAALGEVLVGLSTATTAQQEVDFFTSLTQASRIAVLNDITASQFTGSLTNLSDSQLSSFFFQINPTIFAELTQAQAVVLLVGAGGVAAKSGTDLVNFFTFLDRNFVATVADSLTASQTTTQTPFIGSPGNLGVFFGVFNSGTNDTERTAFLAALTGTQAENLIENQGAQLGSFTNLNTIFQGLSTTAKTIVFTGLSTAAQAVASPSGL